MVLHVVGLTHEYLSWLFRNFLYLDPQHENSTRLILTFACYSKNLPLSSYFGFSGWRIVLGICKMFIWDSCFCEVTAQSCTPHLRCTTLGSPFSSSLLGNFTIDYRYGKCLLLLCDDTIDFNIIKIVILFYHWHTWCFVCEIFSIIKIVKI